MRALSKLILPLLLLAATFYAQTRLLELSSAQLELLGFAPYLLLLVVAALAHYFNRLRIFACALVIAGSYWLMQSQLQSSLTDPQLLWLFTTLSLAIPLNMAYLMALPERGVLSRSGWITLSLLGLQVGLGLYYFNAAGAFVADAWLIPYALNAQALSFAAYAAFSFCFTLGLLLLWVRQTEVEAALLAVLLASFLTLYNFQLLMISALMFSAAALLLLKGLIKSSFDMAYRDELTGLLGRRAFNEKMQTLGRRYTIAMMDVDHFKKFNDTHGHDVGDDVLKMVARQLSQVTGGGTVYRYGGEEFCVIFPRKSLEQCVPHLEKLRHNIEHYKLMLRQTKRTKNSKKGSALRGKKSTRAKYVSVCISIGIAERKAHINKASQVFKEADNKLYKAKRSGRNCLAY